MSDEVKRLIAVLSQIEKCDICEDLVDWHVEFHSRRGDFVRVCRDCLAQALITSDAAEQSVHLTRLLRSRSEVRGAKRRAGNVHRWAFPCSTSKGETRCS